jgi:hypothetical protein
MMQSLGAALALLKIKDNTASGSQRRSRQLREIMGG